MDDDWSAINRDMERLVRGNASDSEIEAYLSAQGLTVDQFNEMSSSNDRQMIEQTLAGLEADRAQQAYLDEHGSDIGHAVGAMNRGVAAFLGFPVDAATGAINAGIWGANQFGADVPYIERPFLGADSIREKLDDWSGLAMEGTNAVGLTDTPPPRMSEVPARTATGRVAGAGAEELASAMAGMGAGRVAQEVGNLGSNAVRWMAEMLTEQPAMQGATSFGAGTGIGAVNEAGGEGLPAELAGAAVGGVGGYGVGKLGGLLNDYLIRPFTAAGRDALVGQVLRDFSQQPVNELAANIRNGLQARETPGVQPTTAAVSRDAGMSALTRGMMNTQGTDMGEIWARRMEDNDAAYREHLGEVGVGVIHPEATGLTLRNAYDQQYRAMQGEVSRAYDAIDPQGTSAIPVDGIWQAMADITQRRFAQRTAGTPQEIRDIMARFGPRTTMTFNQLDTIQQELADLANSYRNVGKNNLADATMDVRAAVMETIDGALPQQARDLRRLQGDLYETGAASMFGRDRYGRPDVETSAIPDAYMTSSYEAGVQFGQTLGQSPVARQQMADHIVRRGIEASEGGAQDLLQGNGLRRFFRRVDPFIRGLRDGGAISQDHYEILQRVTDELRLDQQALRRGMAIGSPTVQNISIAKLISRATGGVVSEGVLGGISLGTPDRISSLLYRMPQREILNRVTEAMLDPELALRLLDRATPGNLQRFDEMFQHRYGTAMGLAALTTEEPIPQ